MNVKNTTVLFTSHTVAPEVKKALGWLWWYMPVVPAIRETDSGGLVELRSVQGQPEQLVGSEILPQRKKKCSETNTPE